MNTEIKELSVFSIIISALKKTFSIWSKFLMFMAIPLGGALLGAIISIVSISILIKGGTALGVTLAALAGVVIGLPLLCYSLWKCFVRFAACFVIAKKMIFENLPGYFDDAEKEISSRSGVFIKFLLWFLLFNTILLASAAIVVYQIQIPFIESPEPMRTIQDIFIMVLNFLLTTFLILSYPAFVFNPGLKALDSIKLGFNIASKNFLSFIGLKMLWQFLLLVAIPLLFLIPTLLFAINKVLVLIPAVVILPLSIALLILIMPAWAIIITYMYYRHE